MRRWIPIAICLLLALPDAASAARRRKPSPPALAGVAIAPSQVRLTWTSSGPAGDGVNVLVDGAPAHHMLADDPHQNAATLHNLRAATTYTFTLRAYTPQGVFSDPSNAVTLTTPAGADVLPPGPPSNLRTYKTPTPSRVSLMWDHGSDDVGIAAYEVLDGAAVVAEIVPSVWYPDVPEWYTTIRHLEPASTHTFTVRTRDEAGNVSAPSNAVTVTLLPSADVTPPGVPGGLWGSTHPNCGFFDLSWNTPADDTDAWHQLDFEIYEDDVFIGIWRDEVHEGAFGRHRYFIRAVDTSGNASAPSATVVLDHGLGC